MAEQDHAHDVDHQPGRPVLDVLAPQQPLPQQAGSRGQGIQVGHIGIGDVVQEQTQHGPHEQSHAQRPSAATPAQGLRLQGRVGLVTPPQPLPPTPARQGHENQLQGGLAIELAAREQHPIQQRADDGQRPTPWIDAQVEQHHGQGQHEGPDFQLRHRHAPGGEQWRQPRISPGEQVGQRRVVEHQGVAAEASPAWADAEAGGCLVVVSCT